MAFCSKCGKKLGTDAKFCSGCGNKLDKKEGAKTKQESIPEPAPFEKEEVSKEETPKPLTSKKISSIGWMAAAVVCVIVVILLVIKMQQGGQDGGTPTQTGGGSGLPAVIQSIVKKAECGNGQCESGESASNCCLDCNCPSGYSCDGNSCKKLAQCGNGIKEEGETPESCCIDAGCPTGRTCQNNKCIELKPELDGSFIQTSESKSVTFLKAKGSNIGQISLTNKGNDDASNVKVVLSSLTGYFSDKTIDFGTIYKNAQGIKLVDLTFLDRVLDVTTDETAAIKATITFYNSANTQYISEENFNIQIAGRNYMTWGKPEMVASWITSTQPTIREFATKATAGLAAGMDKSSPIEQQLAARWLFESMRAYGVQYVNDAHSSADYVQFPYETLKNKAGDCDDNAVLYAALLEAIGMKSFLMPVPGHIFAGYIDSNGFAVPIETTASNFDIALSAGSYQYNQYKDKSSLIYPTASWANYPAVNLPEKNQLNMPSITKQIGACSISFNLQNFFVASAPVKFVNSGNAPGAGCAAVATYQNGQLRDQVYKCWTLNPGETKETTFQPDINILSGYSCWSI